jgi:hypothetical protein
MRREPEYFGEREVELLYVAKRLKEALAVEELLTERSIDYVVQPEEYFGGLIFQRVRIGAFFYVLPEAAPAAREALRAGGFRPHRGAE